MEIPIEEVPVGIHRKVAQLLENIRGTEMADGADKAVLSGAVTAIYRLDIDDIAYFEFEVDLQKGASKRIAARTMGADDKAERNMPASRGFVIASAAPHDFPIPHWSLNREPPSVQLRRAAEERGQNVARIYKLDALSYIGENTDGELAAQSGQMPLPIEGLPDDPADGRGKISSTIARPSEAINDDSKADGIKHQISRRGSRVRKVSLREVGSWGELKDSYTGAFKPLLADLRHQANEAWTIDALVEKFGEGIHAGTSHRVALLEPKAAAELSGEGAEYVELEFVEGPTGDMAIELTVAEKRFEQEQSFELHISYGNGLREDLKFFAVSPTTPSNRRSDSGLRAFDEED